MNTLEIKNDLLRLMVETNDQDLLNKVRRYFKFLKNEPINQSEIEKQEFAMIDLGLQQIEKGEVISHKDARNKINEMLGINRS